MLVEHKLACHACTAGIFRTGERREKQGERREGLSVDEGWWENKEEDREVGRRMRLDHKSHSSAHQKAPPF